MEFDLLIKGARTRFSHETLLDIGIENERIRKIGEDLGGRAKQRIDADGKLVTESFVNGHLHLCKVYTLTMVGDTALSSYTSRAMGGAMTAIEQAASVKEHYAENWIIENVRRAMGFAIKFGNTHIRTFADTDTRAKLEGVKAFDGERKKH
jgi:cytosine deaminase